MVKDLPNIIYQGPEGSCHDPGLDHFSCSWNGLGVQAFGLDPGKEGESCPQGLCFPICEPILNS